MVIIVSSSKSGHFGEPKECHYQCHWCSGIMQDSHSCDPGSIPGRRMAFCFALDYFYSFFFL